MIWQVDVSIYLCTIFLVLLINIWCFILSVFLGFQIFIVFQIRIFIVIVQIARTKAETRWAELTLPSIWVRVQVFFFLIFHCSSISIRLHCFTINLFSHACKVHIPRILFWHFFMRTVWSKFLFIIFLSTTCAIFLCGAQIQVVVRICIYGLPTNHFISSTPNQLSK